MRRYAQICHFDGKQGAGGKKVGFYLAGFAELEAAIMYHEDDGSFRSLDRSERELFTQSEGCLTRCWYVPAGLLRV